MEEDSNGLGLQLLNSHLETWSWRIGSKGGNIGYTHVRSCYTLHQPLKRHNGNSLSDRDLVTNGDYSFKMFQIISLNSVLSVGLHLLEIGRQHVHLRSAHTAVVEMIPKPVVSNHFPSLWQNSGFVVSNRCDAQNNHHQLKIMKRVILYPKIFVGEQSYMTWNHLRKGGKFLLLWIGKSTSLGYLGVQWCS